MATKVDTPIIKNPGDVNRQLYRYYDKAFDWVMDVGPRIIVAIIILLIGLWLIRVIRRRLSNYLTHRKVHSSLRPFFISLTFTALHVVLAFLIMQILGIKLTVFAAVIAAFGAAAGLALSGTLQNFASGILILLLKPFNVDDNIIAQGLEGTVTSIQIFYTIIKTYDNRTVIMPNSKLSNEVIINITYEGNRRLDITMKFNYGQDIGQLKKIVSDALSSFPEVIKDIPFRVGISNMEQDGFTLDINVWIAAHGFEDARLQIIEKLIAAIKGAGIKLSGM